MAAVTRLGLYGGPRGPYGSFDGKEEGVVVVDTARSKGWLPLRYLDEEGQEVDLDAVEEAVEAVVEKARPKRAQAVQKASDRVLGALRTNDVPKPADMKRLKLALAHHKQALAALVAAVEAQQREDDEILVLLFAA